MKKTCTILGTAALLAVGVRAEVRLGAPAYSPDGKSLAFQAERNGTIDIGVRDLESGRVTWIEDGPQRAYHPSWTPDGGILFVCGDITQTAYEQMKSGAKEGYNLYLWRNGETRRLTRGRWMDSTPCASPDGRTVYYASTCPGVRHGWADNVLMYAMPVGAQENAFRVVRSAGGTPGAAVSQPVLSRDGRYIAWAEEGSDTENWRILVSKVGAENEPCQLTPLTMAAYEPRWSPDGRLIAFTGFRPDDPGWGVYLADVRTGAVKRLCDGESPDFAPDGKRLAYSRDGRIRFRDMDAADLPRGEAEVKPPVPERVLARLEKPAKDASAALPPDFTTDAKGGLFIRARLTIKGKPPAFEHICVCTFGEHPTGFQLYVKDGQVYFATRRSDGLYLGKWTDGRLPDDYSGTVTGYRTDAGLVLRVEGLGEYATYSSVAPMRLADPKTYRIGIPTNEGAGSKTFSGTVDRLEFGCGMPKELSAAKTLKEMFE